MGIKEIIVIAIILAVDIILLKRDLNQKLIYKGKKQFSTFVITMLVVFIIMTAKDLKLSTISIIIAMIPLAFIGNKNGITEEGILSKSYLTPWDKVEEFSFIKQVNNYVLQYKSNVGYRKVCFDEASYEEVNKLLSSNRKLRHRRKK